MIGDRGKKRWYKFAEDEIGEYCQSENEQKTYCNGIYNDDGSCLNPSCIFRVNCEFREENKKEE